MIDSDTHNKLLWPVGNVRGVLVILPIGIFAALCILSPCNLGIYVTR